MSKFKNKYESSISTATEEILDKYDIAPNSKLARIINISIKKCLLGLDLKLMTYTNWFNKHGEQVGLAPEQFKEAYPRHLAIMASKFNVTALSPEFDLLLKIDIGRSKVISDIYKLIYRNINEIGARKTGDPSEALLGSIIRRTIDIYYDKNGKDITVSVYPSPKQSMESLKKLRAKMAHP